MGRGQGGSAAEAAGSVLWEEEAAGPRQRNNELHYPHSRGCLYFMYQNATCSLPSVLHSLTVYLPNNRRPGRDGQDHSGSRLPKPGLLAYLLTSTTNRN